MKLWIKILAGAIPGAVLLLATLLLCWRRRRQRLVNPHAVPQFSEAAPMFNFDSINKTHLSYKSGSSARSSLRFHHLNHYHHTPAIHPSSPFNWDEHPRLITEAVETGWPRFAFSASTPRASSGQFWSFCSACDGGAQPEAPESGWDIPPGSSEFMQTVRLNPSPKRTADDPSFSWLRMSLPLPGPPLGGGSFPQEAYFEISILHLQPRKKLQPTGSKRTKDRESDRAKLIRGNSINAAASIISAFQDPSSALEQTKSGDLAVALGLIKRPSLPSQSMPGTFPGSIGFHSDGSVYLDGRKLVFESEKAGWAGVNKVIGCGFEPSQNKVFFTVDSQLAHVIRCSSVAYSSPLYPVLAAEADAMILVNLGQAPFKYSPANATRTQNPCFLRITPGDVPAVGSVDSRELFSVSRMETELLEHGKRSTPQNNSSGSKKSNGNLDDGIDADSDLFEISLQR